MSEADKILDKALQLGSEKGWERLALTDIAQSLHISLAEIYEHYKQKDDLVEAWFDRADRVLLKRGVGREWAGFKPVQRLHTAIFCWLDALGPYRKLTAQMLLYKLEPGHIHLQAAGILRISRTVQWFRETAALRAGNLKRIAQELELTRLYLMTFIRWLKDDSPKQQESRQFLATHLARGDRFDFWS
ncbi:TetR/AcrR family transcriptional regulator [Bowmanella dokdonensis]|uniref:TetR/AcrR family transcriptional regulator n=1 Tax=Bowmanella dokdonensis TaxID=751969 RepID=A0A939DQN2_9ALTE|nr:TetR/AcrR family transcriptional regulator [Bowmanella dokdonensis]MBN7826602.1 TetR/AcrR family transcriptional regulator [Bowmanella dokdonensis]